MIYLVSNIQNMEGNLGLSDQIRTAEIEEVFQYCSQLKYISVDTETDGVDWHKNKVIMLQIGDEHNQFVIDNTEDYYIVKSVDSEKICNEIRQNCMDFTS